MDPSSNVAGGMPWGRVCCLIVNLLVKTSEREPMLRLLLPGWPGTKPSISLAPPWPHLWPEETWGEPKLLPEAQTGFRFAKQTPAGPGTGQVTIPDLDIGVMWVSEANNLTLLVPTIAPSPRSNTGPGPSPEVTGSDVKTGQVWVSPAAQGRCWSRDSGAGRGPARHWATGQLCRDQREERWPRVR